ncbi:hypothetical protein H072_1322 [Dactylellina haptotyla CBS 200.50]|uniref:Peroxin/Ferlin domain-containing protein n=1 Tax=Dactylellina haptotyla (strain CBS 200.50) TaxID=1284197 RepID=S8AP77_DACHA|nr:hypothetical protein H072_1322 [Dactylellina haptotyla CBS 200.50]
MSVKRFSLGSQRQNTEPEFSDHFIVLKDNTVPSPTNPNSLSRATTKDLSNLSENNSPIASTTVSRVQSIASLTDRIDRIGTINTTASTVPSLSQTSSNPAFVPGHKRKESLRKHLAERKYHREWKQKHNKANTNGEASGKSSSNSSDNSSSDEESEFSLPNGKDGKKIKRIDSRRYKDEMDRIKDFPTAVLSKKDEIQSKGTRALRKARQVGRRVRKEELIDDAGELDILYENQRGTFFFGIPLFSAKSLLPVDSAPWTNRHHAPSAVNIFTAQVPDPSWAWAWKSFAVDMTGDVDEEGWQYSFAFRGTKWHGNAVWWHGFVRRRRWIRKRVKRRITSTIEDAHSLTPEYFTIHSRNASLQAEPSGYYSSSIRSMERNSKLDEYPTATQQESDDSELEDFEIQDIPTLTKAFRRARLDREKLEALSNFLLHGGSEVMYLADSMPQIMRSMIFQQSRRQLLQIILDTLYKAKDKRQSRELGNGAPKKHLEKEFDDDEEKRYIDGLGRAVEAGEEEVRKLEYWSDIKRVEYEGYGGVESTGNYTLTKDGDDSDYEHANIWKARGKFMNRRKEQISGRARGSWGERDESDRSTIESRGADAASLKGKEKGKGKAKE